MERAMGIEPTSEAWEAYDTFVTAACVPLKINLIEQQASRIWRATEWFGDDGDAHASPATIS
jgi:hypothetical protein